MKASICMASYDRPPEVLEKVFDSIFQQHPPFEFEVVLVDDGSEGNSTREVCSHYPVNYVRIHRAPVRRNPTKPRNLAYRFAKGEVLICQSDDVVHISQNLIQSLVKELTANPGRFVLATVLGCDVEGKPEKLFAGPQGAYHVFFLGALWRKDLYAVGGNDEDFDKVQSAEDCWLEDCLRKGLGLQPYYPKGIIGHHLYHDRRVGPAGRDVSQVLLEQKRREAEETGVWCSKGGPWPWKE